MTWFAMPQDPFIREKFTRLRAAARQLAADYFERFPKDRYLKEVEAGAICNRTMSSSRSSGCANRSTPAIIAVDVAC
jgi:hypothetical protein